MDVAMLVRFVHPARGQRVGLLRAGLVSDVTDVVGSVGQWLKGSAGRPAEAIRDLLAAADQADTRFLAGDFAAPAGPGGIRWLPPIDDQDVWAAGVTYLRSRDARQVEAVDGGDVYARVYAAERPELFYKARGTRVVGPGGDVGIRRDAAWSVPEPELGLVINPALEIVGWLAGNDMSSRDIEGANPLYLPQAKMYDKSCALGPAIALQLVDEGWPDLTIDLGISRAGRQIFAGSTTTARIRRSPRELVDYLGRCLAFPDGAILLTGTGIVPPDDFSLAAGDVVEIAVGMLPPLINPVVVV